MIGILTGPGSDELLRQLKAGAVLNFYTGTPPDGPLLASLVHCTRDDSAAPSDAEGEE